MGLMKEHLERMVRIATNIALEIYLLNQAINNIGLAPCSTFTNCLIIIIFNPCSTIILSKILSLQDEKTNVHL